MARGRGRGRMRFRARPPPSVRNSMQELGISANANYSVPVADILGAQVDAARAYFPALESGPAPAVPPTEKERELISRFEIIRSTLRESPAAVRASGPRKSSLVTELCRARAFFQPGIGDMESPPRGDLWDVERPWLIPEMLPQELRKTQTSIKRKTDAGEPEPMLDGLTVQAMERMESGGEDEERMDKDGDTGREIEGLAEGEEDDLQLNADYETGAHFDDDDGYEEADSGKEEAVF